MGTMDIARNGRADAQDLRPFGAAPAARTTWQIDPAASRVEFAIGKRLAFVRRLTVTGRFTDVRGKISLDEREPSAARADVTIGAASIDTGNARRDTHLRTADFFDVERYPTLRFTSRRIAAIDAAAGRYRVTGDLTIRDVTREVQLDAHYSPPPLAASMGEPGLMLTLTTEVHRADFGLGWSNPIIAIADDLTVTLAVFLV